MNNFKVVEAREPLPDTDVLCTCGCGIRIFNPVVENEDGTYTVLPVTQETLDRIKSYVDSGKVKHK